MGHPHCPKNFGIRQTTSQNTIAILSTKHLKTHQARRFRGMEHKRQIVASQPIPPTSRSGQKPRSTANQRSKILMGPASDCRNPERAGQQTECWLLLCSIPLKPLTCGTLGRSLSRHFGSTDLADRPTESDLHPTRHSRSTKSCRPCSRKFSRRREFLIFS